MRKIKYSRDVDALLVELSDKPIDYAEEEIPQILKETIRKGIPVYVKGVDERKSISCVWKGVNSNLPL